MFIKVILSIVLLISTPAFAKKNIARLIKQSGEVTIYSNPGDKITGPTPHIKYKGKFYSLKKGRLGTKINNGNYILTGPNSKAKIVFPNGDQFSIGPNTAYEFKWSWGKKRGKPKSVVNLLRGSFRAIVSPKGNRSGMKVKTPRAALGVRGTDFFVRQSGTLGKTEVSVIRGSVDLKKDLAKEFKLSRKDKKAVQKSPIVKVSQGESAEVLIGSETDIQKNSELLEQPVKAKDVKINLITTTKEDLVKIQVASTIRKEEQKKIEEVQNPTPELKKEIEKLEKVAVKNTLEDIKRYDPKLFTKMKGQKVASTEKLNTEVIKKVMKLAPKKVRKPELDDLEDLGDDAYDKFFKID